MPRMSEQVAQDVMGISRDDRFGRLWAHFKSLEDEMQTQINDPMTPKDEREILVHVRQQFKKEVLEVVKTAQRVLQRKDEMTGQA